MRHGERQEQGLGGAFPPTAGRVTETRGGTRGVQQDMKGVNRSLSPWRQNTHTLDPPSDYVPWLGPGESQSTYYMAAPSATRIQRWDLDDVKQNLYVTWTHNFGSNFDPQKDTAYWAWTYPYSFEESLEKSQKWISKFAKKYTDVYTNREVICYSREKRPVELLTVTKDTKRLEEREELIEGLFPEAKGDLTTRPFKFDKPTIFISARVHPGETPASYVLDGIMKFLLRPSE